MFEDVKKGDKVWSFVYGWGVVEDIRKKKLQITVKFKNERDTFTLDGKMYKTDMYQTLFWDEVKFEIPNKPLPDLPIDTKLLVWGEKDKRKYKRHFKKFNKNGKIVCFSYGETSWTAGDDETEWDYLEVVDEKRTADSN